LLDVTTPAAPQLVGSFETVYGDSDPIIADGLYFMVGGGLYFPFALRVVDFSDPANVREAGVFEIPEFAPDGLHPTPYLVRDGNVITVVVGGEQRAVDVSDPEALVGVKPVGAAPPAPTPEPPRYRLQASVVQQLDQADPDNPVVTGEFTRPAFTAHNVAVIGSVAYVATEQGSLQLLDVTDPTAPRLMQSIPGIAEWVFAVGPYLGTVERSGQAPARLRFWDTAAAPDLTLISDTEIPVTSSILDLTPGDGRLYIAAAGGLRLVDISNLSEPRPAGFWTTVAPINGVAAAGDVAYLAAGDGLHVLDVSNPDEPQEVGTAALHLGQSCLPDESVPFPFFMTDVTLLTGEIIVSGFGPTSCLITMNVNDPAQPVPLKPAETGLFLTYYNLLPWRHFIMAVTDETAVATDVRLSLTEQNFPPDTLVVQAAELELEADFPPRYVVQEPYIFLANGREGLLVVEIVDK
jgi:hypothetical protein